MERVIRFKKIKWCSKKRNSKIVNENLIEYIFNYHINFLFSSLNRNGFEGNFFFIYNLFNFYCSNYGTDIPLNNFLFSIEAPFDAILGFNWFS